MAADHRRKRLNGVSIAGCSSWEQYKTKKKKLGSPKNELNTKSHISLEWDGDNRQVIAKREQIGFRQKDLREFIDPFSQRHGILADVLAIPQELFELENLTEVLSFEVWNTHLSENERKYLMQFLPRGSDAEEVVHALLAGDNFHFGNPHLKWGGSLCSGNLHPDAIIHQEQCIKADKKLFYSEIQNYHADMIKYLQKLKETCETSKDFESEVAQKIWRSRRDVDKRISSCENDTRFYNLEESAVDTSESCSLFAEENVCSSDNQNSSVKKSGELHRRTHDKGFMKEKTVKPLVASDDARPRREEKLRKRNIQHTDGVKYMSYLKISKKQHQLVKSMKQSGKSIQSKSLNRVLGSLDTLQVQPYEVFVKEEQTKLQEHWIQLARKDLPAAYEIWRHIQFQRREIMKSLEQDINDRLESSLEDGHKVNDDSIVQYQNEQGAREHESEAEDKDEISQDAVLKYENDQVPKQHELFLQTEEKLNEETDFEDLNDQDLPKYESNVEDEEKDSDHTVLSEDQHDGVRNHVSYVKNNEDSGPGSPQYHSQRQISSTSGDNDLSPIDMGPENNHLALKSDNTSSDASQYLGNANTVDASTSTGIPISSGRDIWPEDNMPQTFYNSSMNHAYAANGELSLPQPIDEAQRPQLIDLESNVVEEDTRNNLLHRQSDGGSFSSYPNQDRNGLLQSLFKGQEMLPYHREHKQMGLDFQLPQHMLMGDGHFSGQLQRQIRTPLQLEHGLKRHTENYIEPSMSGNLYSQGGAYSVQRQGLVPSVNLQNWPVNPVRMSARLPSHLNNDPLLTQNWYSGEHQLRGAWNSANGTSISGQGIGSNTDQGLFSALSHYNQLNLSNHSNPMGPTEHFMLPRNYEMASGVPSSIDTSLPQASLPLDYGTRREAPSSLISDELGWMSLPQNPGLHDPVGKPYLRSWNQ